MNHLRPGATFCSRRGNAALARPGPEPTRAQQEKSGELCLLYSSTSTTEPPELVPSVSLGMRRAAGPGRGLERWLRALAAPAEEPSSLPSTHARQLATTWNSGSRGFATSGLHGYPLFHRRSNSEVALCCLKRRGHQNPCGTALSETSSFAG